MSENLCARTHLMLSAQRALLGQVPPSLRAVSVELAGKTIYFRTIFDGVPHEDEKELLSCAATEIISDFSTPYTLETECLHIESPHPMNHRKFLVFSRFETPIS